MRGLGGGFKGGMREESISCRRTRTAPPPHGSTSVLSCASLLPPPKGSSFTPSQLSALPDPSEGWGGGSRIQPPPPPDPQLHAGLLRQRQLRDVIDPDQLPDPKTAKVLERFDIAEPGDGIQELDGRRRETLGGLKPQKAASAFQCFAKEAAVAGQGSMSPPNQSITLH